MRRAVGQATLSVRRENALYGRQTRSFPFLGHDVYLILCVEKEESRKRVDISDGASLCVDCILHRVELTEQVEAVEHEGPPAAVESVGQAGVPHPVGVVHHRSVVAVSGEERHVGRQREVLGEFHCGHHAVVGVECVDVAEVGSFGACVAQLQVGFAGEVEPFGGTPCEA